ncbi:hypothetical protein [Streptomyces sp. CB01881]|uniref:hypothetical protein n=1 Tax=Streptomyces sp. CB01881 TaxID=2078691 RepID=UPI000CDCB6C2|nr:hypothetical protein [Streptomyces sp. CB01881]AUY48255.1 hypothetical protein C2142_03965 [Streptomyces sp. CB01881]TYC76746.1 hypothetical protein EH183_03975 [Streptomyces sp. CB01881]
MAKRKLLLPVAATSALLVFSGFTLDVAVAAPAPVSGATATATAPAAASATAATLAPPADGVSTATVAIPAKGGESVGAAAPAAPATPAGAPALALTSYDPRTGDAVLTAAGNAAATSGTSTADVQPGRLIDSPPTPAAPQGALVAVTGVKEAFDGTVAVSTRPATLPELLGDANTSLKAPVDPASIRVEPQVEGLKASVDIGPTSGRGTITSGLGLSADATVPLPNGSSVRLSGSVRIDPAVSFSYQGGLGVLAPQQARVGFDLGAHADWHVSGTNLAAGASVKIPLAKLGASPVVMVGPLPVVINLNLTLSAAISADGTVTIDAEQSYDGHWGVHSDYAVGQGWTTTTEPGTSTVSPLRLALSGNASVRTGLLAEGSIALYDAVGVKASIEPYLRTAVNGSVVLGGATPSVNGTLDLYGGLDIDGALMARLVVLGTPVLEKELPFLAFHREWPITSQSVGQAPTGSPVWTQLDSSAGDDNRSAYLKTRPDWDSGARKASCPDGSRLIGLSHGSDRGLCTNATQADPWDAGHASTVVHDETYVTTDWAYGYTKAQCPAGHVATGYSRNGRSIGVLCAKSAVPLSTSVRTVWFDKGDNRPAAAGGGDFAYRYSKGQCADGEFVAGVAYSQPWYELWASRPYALLCRKPA